MKHLILTITLLFLLSLNPFYSQDNLRLVVLSPFIGEKLDSIEQNYFYVFPGVSDLQEATFYVDQDSSLSFNIKYYLNNKLIDTSATYTYKYPLSYLRDKIAQVLVKDIKEGKVNELEFNTSDNQIFEGTVYSSDDEQIMLIKNGFTELKDYKEQEDYISMLKYPNIKSMKINTTSTEFIVLSTLALGIMGGFAGASLGQEEKESYSQTIGGIVGALIGSVVGFAIGMIVKLPAEYDIIDSDTKQIIKENSLLPSGL